MDGIFFHALVVVVDEVCCRGFDSIATGGPLALPGVDNHLLLRFALSTSLLTALRSSLLLLLRLFSITSFFSFFFFFFLFDALVKLLVGGGARFRAAA